MADLRFANGVAIGPEDAFVLVNETLAARVHRLWLQGPWAGTRDLFLDGLPGYPDNLSYNGHGLFWVALAAPRVAALDRLAGHPRLRQVLFRLPAGLTNMRPPAGAWVLGVDVHGAVRHHLRETTGRYANATSVQEVDGVLWLGSLFGRAVGRAQAPAGPYPLMAACRAGAWHALGHPTVDAVTRLDRPYGQCWRRGAAPGVMARPADAPEAPDSLGALAGTG
jgi:hypothetical protein